MNKFDKSFRGYNVSQVNAFVDDVVTNGIAFSDSFVLELAQSRLPAEYFKQTIVTSGDKKSSNLRQST